MLRSSVRAVTRLPVRGLAPKKGKQAEAPAAAPTGSLSATEVTGCNIYKNGTDPPILPDAEYPEWLWKLASPGATLKELERKGPDSLEMDELKRYVKLYRRDEIKTGNFSRSKN